MSEGEAGERECPDCGEAIKVAAKKCRFCGTFFDAGLKAARRDRGRKAGKPSPDSREVASSIFILLGIPGYLVCSLNHTCMTGHWQHPPYPTWHYATEGLWIVGFAVAMVVTVQSQTCRRWVRPLVLGCVFASLLLLGGALAPLDLLFVIPVGVASLVSLSRRVSMGRVSSSGQ